MAVFSKNSGRGNSTLQGRDGVYDQVDYNGEVEDYTFTRNADRPVTVDYPDFGTDTLISIGRFVNLVRHMIMLKNYLVPARRFGEYPVMVRPPNSWAAGTERS